MSDNDKLKEFRLKQREDVKKLDNETLMFILNKMVKYDFAKMGNREEMATDNLKEWFDYVYNEHILYFETIKEIMKRLESKEKNYEQ